MSSQLGVSSEPRHSTAIIPPSPNLANLPQELLRQIFCRLSPPDLQAASLASRGMNCSVKEAAHFHEFHSLKNFIRTLIQKLPEQKERLVEIAQNMVFQDFANLLLLKRSILYVKAQLIGVIKTVDEERAKGLHDVQPPHFLEDIFTLAAFEKQIDAAKLIPNEYIREDAFWEISQALTREGDIDRALAVAWLIPNTTGKKGEALGNISKALALAGNFDRSLAVAWSIPDTWWAKTDALRDISLALAQKGAIDRSLVVVRSIPDEIQRGYALRDISEALTQKGDIERARFVLQGLIP